MVKYWSTITIVLYDTRTMYVPTSAVWRTDNKTIARTADRRHGKRIIMLIIIIIIDRNTQITTHDVWPADGGKEVEVVTEDWTAGRGRSRCAVGGLTACGCGSDGSRGSVNCETVKTQNSTRITTYGTSAVDHIDFLQCRRVHGVKTPGWV